MSPVVNSTSLPSRKIVSRHLYLHLQAQRHMALAICALCLVLGGAVAFSGPRFESVRPLTASAVWAGKPVPVVETGLVFRRGVSSIRDTDGGPTVP
jgi:hypothetical protein